ncbi:hypothetical protein [Sphingomonas sp. MM-1]|uniref:hypothetical protein n=1 Tax=Sphingomonas sp. MM-1 TaxID=745310 RepID=UPI000A05633B|nr:hypothetical protein [Sphingomonas sp. MM-1]
MKQYPISVPRDVYRGANDARRRKQRDYNDAAASVENYINNLLAGEPDDAIYGVGTNEVARKLGLEDELAQRIVFSIDGGHNGATFYKGDYDRAMLKMRGEDV